MEGGMRVLRFSQVQELSMGEAAMVVRDAFNAEDLEHVEAPVFRLLVLWLEEQARDVNHLADELEEAHREIARLRERLGD
jgi:hypothetical protein